MSWHCLFCGSAEAWMRGKEYEDGYGMIEIIEVLKSNSCKEVTKQWKTKAKCQ